MRVATAAVVLLLAAPLSAADFTGEQLYAKRCASCHGANGEGTKKYSQPLTGDRGVKDLAKVIAATMPEDDPGSLAAADADKLAAYVHDAFYSKAAQERNRPPRIELSRLTAGQHLNALADIMSSFRPTAPKPAEANGLRGEYFAWHEDIVTGYYPDARAADRVEPSIRFDWNKANPVPDKIKSEGYSARWTGSFFAPHTGDYEFVVRSENGVRLWVNTPPPLPKNNRGQSADPSPKPLIDAWVGAGTPTDHRGTVRLLGGRAYPIRLQFFKGKEKSASVVLKWKPPLGVEEEMPTRVLSPVLAPATLAARTKFPPDDRSLGWERGTAVSKAWAQATFDAALEAAGYVADHLNELSGMSEKEADPRAKLKAFAAAFAERAFRRPLTADERAKYVDGLFDGAPDSVTGVKRVVAAALLAPPFLYRDAEPAPAGYAVAARLSFALWDSVPDTELLAAAKAGKLATREQVRAQAERMLTDPRAKRKLLTFFHAWLRLDHVTDLGKDAKRFPGFDAVAVADLRVSLDAMLEGIVFGAKSDFRELLLADAVPLNGRLAALYGAPAPAGSGFVNTKLDTPHRAGVLTHPLVLAAHAYGAESSPIHRGVFLTRGVFGRFLRPPAEAFTPFAADLHPALSTRERVALQTKPAGCMTCHGVINPLGFALEHFDAIGRFREKDNAKPIDASGGFRPAAGDEVKFRGARELARYAADGAEVHAALVEQMFSHLAQQPVRAYGSARRAELTAAFAKGEFHLRNLAAEIATTAALPPANTK